MKQLLATLSIIVAAVLAPQSQAEDTGTLAPRLQNVSVTIHSEDGQGSGTIVTRDSVNYILTAGHVVAGNRVVEQVLNEEKTVSHVSFKPVTVVREIYQGGRSVGQTSVEADVLAYSSSEHGHDLALLKLRSQITGDSMEFSPDILPVGTEVVHVGSLLGQEGSNSFTVGNLSQVGRVMFDRVFDQVSCPTFPGSSGGSVSRKSDGKYVGMLVRGAGENFGLIVPIRRMREWAAIHHVEFVFSPEQHADLAKVKLEDHEPVTNTGESGPQVPIFTRGVASTHKKQ